MRKESYFVPKKFPQTHKKNIPPPLKKKLLLCLSIYTSMYVEFLPYVLQNIGM